MKEKIENGETLRFRDSSGGWYLDHIEPPLRELVHYLRNQGVNTSCSCGHEMWVEVANSLMLDIYGLHSVLWDFHWKRFGIVPDEHHSYSLIQRVDTTGPGHSPVACVRINLVWLVEQRAYLESEIAKWSKAGEDGMTVEMIGHRLKRCKSLLSGLGMRTKVSV